MLSNVGIPVCSGGWNKRDSLKQMAAGDAIVYDNLIHQNGVDKVRPGYVSLTGAVPGQLLFPYVLKDNNRLLVVQNGNLTVIDCEGNIKLTHPMGNGSTNERQACTFIDGAGIAHKFITDFTTKVYDFSVTDGKDTIAEAKFTCKDSSQPVLSFPFAYKNRIWFIESNTCRLWYGGVQSVQGDLTSFFVGPFFRNGGHLIAMASWTQDGGNGQDDQLVLFSNQGEVLVYSGLSPEDESWSLVGRYEIPKLFNAKCIAQIKGDLILATTSGYIPLSSVLSELSANRVALSNKINGAVIGKNWDDENWKILYIPDINQIIVNAPSEETGVHYETHVCNLENNTWSRYLGHDMLDMCVLDGELYFVNLHGVWQANVGHTDNGYAIKWQVQPAYSDFGIKQRKKIMRANIAMSSVQPLEVYKCVWTDFTKSGQTIASQEEQTATAGQEWNAAKWNEATWGQVLGSKSIRVGIAHRPAVYISVGFLGSAHMEAELMGADIGLIACQGII